MSQRVSTLFLLSVFLRCRVGVNGDCIGTRIHGALKCLLKAFSQLVDAFVKARLCSPPSLAVGVPVPAWSEGEMVGRGS